MSPLPILYLLIAVGVLLWFVPFKDSPKGAFEAAKLNDLGKWMAVLSFAAWLWTVVGG